MLDFPSIEWRLLCFPYFTPTPEAALIPTEAAAMVSQTDAGSASWAAAAVRVMAVAVMDKADR